MQEEDWTWELSLLNSIPQTIGFKGWTGREEEGWVWGGFFFFCARENWWKFSSSSDLLSVTPVCRASEDRTYGHDLYSPTSSCACEHQEGSLHSLDTGHWAASERASALPCPCCSVPHPLPLPRRPRDWLTPCRPAGSLRASSGSAIDPSAAACYVLGNGVSFP